MSNGRTELQRELVEAFISSKAINFEAVGSLLAKYGARAALTGDGLAVILHKRVIDACIPPEPYRQVEGLRGLVAQAEG